MNSRIGRAIIGLILISVGLNMLSSVGIFGLIMLIGGIAFLAYLANNADVAPNIAPIIEQIQQQFSAPPTPPVPHQRSPRRRRADRRTSTNGTSGKRSRPVGKMHRIAEKAVLEAGQDPAALAVQPMDIGVLAYGKEAEIPTLYRESRLPDDAEYVRPFVVMRSPRRAKGKIRFELLDDMGTRRFIDEANWELGEGETFVYSDTWLPVANLRDLEGTWKLRIYGAGMLLAVHDFMWRDEGGGEFRSYLNGDGEINDELLDGLSSTRMERLSLDDLLDEQDGGLAEVDAEAEAAARRNALRDRRRNQ